MKLLFLIVAVWCLAAFVLAPLLSWLFSGRHKGGRS